LSARPDPDLAEALAAFQRGDLERARDLAEQQLGSAHSPQVEHLLGLIDCRIGRMESGVEWLRRSAEADPANLAFRVMLVRALVDSGRPEEALDIAAPAAAAGPAELALWHARAEAADAAKTFDISAQAWALLCSARPDDWRAWSNYGNALASLERWQEAADALRRAWSINPSEQSIRQNYVGAMVRAGLYEEAADRLKQMLEAGPDDSTMRLTLSRLLADLGKNEDSMAELDKAAELAVGNGASGAGDSGLIRIAIPQRRAGPVTSEEMRGLRELAVLLERTNRVEASRSLLEEAEAEGIAREELGYAAAAIALRDGDAAEARRLLSLESPDEDLVRWHRLMAKILDSLGDVDGAFEAAMTMNSSFRDFDAWVARGADYTDRIRDFIGKVTSEWVAQLKPLEPGPRRSPAFLVGFPRSGTTLLDTFLMGHPDTEVLEEFHMLGAAEMVLGNVRELPDRTPAELAEARRAYFEELDRHADPDFPGLIVDKLPLNMLGLPVIYSLFPDARVIFAQRHPCDAVLSSFMQSFTLNEPMACFLTLEGAAELYDAAMSMFTRSREAMPLKVHTIVYEELVANPEPALRPLIDFLGLDWRPELLDHRATAKSRGAIITPSYDQVVKPLSKARSGRWKRYEKQLTPVLPILLPWAERLGYRD
jgi:tetratricopeptide (TPR) repeat protein